MSTRQRFWIVYGISTVKRYIAVCKKRAMQKATPVRQLMTDLPACQVTPTNKPFRYCGVDYLGLYFIAKMVITKNVVVYCSRADVLVVLYSYLPQHY